MFYTYPLNCLAELMSMDPLPRQCRLPYLESPDFPCSEAPTDKSSLSMRRRPDFWGRRPSKPDTAKSDWRSMPHTKKLGLPWQLKHLLSGVSRSSGLLLHSAKLSLTKYSTSATLLGQLEHLFLLTPYAKVPTKTA